MELIDDDSVRRMLDETCESIIESARQSTERGFRRDRNKFLRILEELGTISSEALEDFSPREQGRYRRDVWSCSMLLLLCHPAVRRCLDWESYGGSEAALPSVVMKFLRDEHSKWVVKSGQSRKTEARK